MLGVGSEIKTTMILGQGASPASFPCGPAIQSLSCGLCWELTSPQANRQRDGLHGQTHGLQTQSLNSETAAAPAPLVDRQFVFRQSRAP